MLSTHMYPARSYTYSATYIYITITITYEDEPAYRPQTSDNTRTPKGGYIHAKLEIVS